MPSTTNIEEHRQHWMSMLNEPSTPRRMQADPCSPLWNMCEHYVHHYAVFVLSEKHMPIDWRDELVQDTLITIHQRLSRFRQLSHFTSWIEGVTRLKAKELFRQKTHVGPWAQALWNALPDEHTKGMPMVASPENIYVLQETFTTIERIFQEFCEGHRSATRTAKILNLALFEGQEVKQIAAVAGVTVTSVNRTIRLARQFLQTKIHEEDAFERIPSPLQDEEK